MSACRSVAAASRRAAACFCSLMQGARGGAHEVECALQIVALMEPSACDHGWPVCPRGVSVHRGAGPPPAVAGDTSYVHRTWCACASAGCRTYNRTNLDPPSAL
eukprot:scaffold3070_cov133-Isochrysis_galbana.AAC.6